MCTCVCVVLLHSRHSVEPQRRRNEHVRSITHTHTHKSWTPNSSVRCKRTPTLNSSVHHQKTRNRVKRRNVYVSHKYTGKNGTMNSLPRINACWIIQWRRRALFCTRTDMINTLQCLVESKSRLSEATHILALQRRAKNGNSNVANAGLEAIHTYEEQGRNA